MRKILLLQAFLALAFLASPAKAYTFSSVRSLSAAGAITTGAEFNLPTGTGGLQWTVVLAGSSPTLSYQIQIEMTDGTWAPLAAPVALTGTIPTAVFTYSGPFADMRVVITAWTSGTLTADIFCTN
jgi:hypothetical protein